MDTYGDKRDQIRKLEKILEDERKEERAFKLIHDSYEREVAKLLNSEEEVKERRPASADSPTKSLKCSPKTSRALLKH